MGLASTTSGGKHYFQALMDSQLPVALGGITAAVRWARELLLTCLCQASAGIFKGKGQLVYGITFHGVGATLYTEEFRSCPWKAPWCRAYSVWWACHVSSRRRSGWEQRADLMDGQQQESARPPQAFHILIRRVPRHCAKRLLEGSIWGGGRRGEEMQPTARGTASPQEHVFYGAGGRLWTSDFTL